jgi:lipopolysaccharide transport system ATP-binding protein
VLFVSHNMAAIEVLCSSAILLSEGRVKAKGETAKIVQDYLTEMSHDARIPLSERRDRDGTGVLRFTSVSLASGDGQKLGAFQCGSASTLALEFDNTSGEDLKNVRVAIGIDNDLAQRVLLLDSILLGKDIPRIAPGCGVVRFIVPKLSLVPGRYHFTIFSTVNGTIADWIKGAGSFSIESGDYFGTGQLPPQGQGIFMTEHTVEYAAS